MTSVGDATNWLCHWILLIVGKNDHVLAFDGSMFKEKCCHVAEIVDEDIKLLAFPNVVDTNKKRFPTA